MFKILKLNNISQKGLERFQRDKYELTENISSVDAVLVRSADMHGIKIPDTIKAIVRAGVGVNNIPVQECSERGIVVFNTPGANSNAVKELVIASLFLSSRKFHQGINWARTLSGDGDALSDLIEKGKSEFAGPEISGKKLGVIGLGAIGILVANDATLLGMEVQGYDPYISVAAAWGLSNQVKKAVSLEGLLADSDYVTLHLPLNDLTRGMLNSEKFSLMKKGARLLNFARGPLVVTDDIVKAVDQGKIGCYVTDFPEKEFLNNEKIIPIPHLGASTPESEENCAVMAADQLIEYLEKGNILNSVNYPDCILAMTGRTRLTVANKNVPKIIGQITGIIAEAGSNIAEMLNRNRNEYAYNIIDIDGEIAPDTLNRIREIQGVVMARVI